MCLNKHVLRKSLISTQCQHADGEGRGGMWDITHTFIKLILNKQNQFPLKSKRADYNGNSKQADSWFVVHKSSNIVFCFPAFCTEYTLKENVSYSINKPLRVVHQQCLLKVAFNWRKLKRVISLCLVCTHRTMLKFL